MGRNFGPTAGCKSRHQILTGLPVGITVGVVVGSLLGDIVGLLLGLPVGDMLCNFIVHDAVFKMR